MKNLLFALLILGASTAKGQATFEHNYPAISGYTPPVEIEGQGTFYQVLQAETLQLYTEAHALYKSIPHGANSPYIVNVSSKLVNGDGQMEVIYYCQEEREWVTKIISEDGQVIQQMAGTSWVVEINGNYKLEVYRDGGVDIYSLPGSMPTGLREGRDMINLKPYPNPASGEVHLPYKLDYNQSAELIVCDMEGRAIRQFTVSGAFSDLIIYAGELPPGQYVYSVYGAENSQGGKFIVR